jgi:glycosyltransferase involved in cell wall biosynthesis
MKIAFLLPSLSNKGPVIFTYNLIKGLLERGIECEVFYFNEPVELVFSVKCTKIGFFKPFDFSSFDVVHSTMAKPDAYIFIHKNNIKAKKVSSLHCFVDEDLIQLRGKLIGGIYSFIWLYCLKNIKNLIFSSNEMSKYYFKKLKEKKRRLSTIIPYGIPNPIVQKIDDKSDLLLRNLRLEYKTILLGCGNLIKRKGFYQLINYLATNDNAAVVIIGDGICLDELKEQAIRMGVLQRTVFLGFRENSFNYYSYCDIFCMSSNSEGFGLAMLEAMSLGMPIVCSDLEIYKDYFTSDFISLFQFGNENSFNSAINLVINNKEKYISGSHTLFKKYFSLKIMSERHKEFYNFIGNDDVKSHV